MMTTKGFVSVFVLCALLLVVSTAGASRLVEDEASAPVPAPEPKKNRLEKLTRKGEWEVTQTYQIKGQDGLLDVVSKAKESDLILIVAYAHWCAHCKKFRPKLEKVANYFNTGRDNSASSDLPRVFVSRIDCALSHLKPLCEKLGVAQYPTAFYGSPGQFRYTLDEDDPEGHPIELEQLDLIAIEENHKKVEVPLGVIDAMEQALITKESLEAGTKLGKFVITPELREQFHDDVVQKKVFGGGGVDGGLHDMEVATALSLRYLAQAINFKKEGARSAFINWQGWIAYFHPSGNCMKGAQDILSEIDTLWPENEDPSVLEQRFQDMQQCGNFMDISELDENAFFECEEYSCGLWKTFHAMSVEELFFIKDQEGSEDVPVFTGEDMMNALTGYIDKFFMCSVCRTHFLQVLAQDNVKDVKSQKDFALWLWEAHNVVNKRLAKEEEENNEGKPDRPKVIFPTREVCPVCFVDPYSDVYSKDDVFEYLKLSYFNVHRAMPGDYKNTMEQEIPPWLSDDMPLEDPRALHDEFAEAIREKEKVMKKMNKHGNHSVVKVLGGVVGVVVACLVLLYIFVHNDAASKKRQNKYY